LRLIFRWRTNRLIKTLVRAKEKCRAAGIEPKEVPPEIIHPLLEAASDLQEAWANLLANAAAKSSLHPAFPGMLIELSSREVLFLDALVDAMRAKEPKQRRRTNGACQAITRFKLKTALLHATPDAPEFYEMTGILTQTGIMEAHGDVRTLEGGELARAIRTNF
jgi:hypothetical protein